MLSFTWLFLCISKDLTFFFLKKGCSAKSRPRGQAIDLQVKAPQQPEEEEDDIDPFDTGIVDTVIPVRAAPQQPKEEEDFDPTLTFNSTKVEIDPFDTSIAGEVIPELADKKPEPVEQEEEIKTPPIEEKPITPSPEPVNAKKAPPPPPPKRVDEIAKKYGRARPRKPLKKQLTDEEFDPRA